MRINLFFNYLESLDAINSKKLLEQIKISSEYYTKKEKLEDEILSNLRKFNKYHDKMKTMTKYEKFFKSVGRFD
jgi:hypothetical protein